MAARPELSGQEYESSGKIVKIVVGDGYSVEYLYSELQTLFRVSFVRGEDTSIGLSVGYDTLPGIVGHACGHNLHGTISVLTGLVLKDLAEEFQGEVYVVGTTAEETYDAKSVIVRKGDF